MKGTKKNKGNDNKRQLRTRHTGTRSELMTEEFEVLKSKIYGNQI